MCKHEKCLKDEASEEFNVGSPWKPDVEAILSLRPDAVILHTTTRSIEEKK